MLALLHAGLLSSPQVEDAKFAPEGPKATQMKPT